jgi:hypothetical protein
MRKGQPLTIGSEEEQVEHQAEASTSAVTALDSRAFSVAEAAEAVALVTCSAAWVISLVANQAKA